MVGKKMRRWRVNAAENYRPMEKGGNWWGEGKGLWWCHHLVSLRQTFFTIRQLRPSSSQDDVLFSQHCEKS